MDSITQIVLGAACGEAVLGKKIGNKALFFGAIGGTIPDLDVFIGNWIYTNEIDAMIFHRGFMHSILFAILGAFLFGWLTYKAYEHYKNSIFLNTIFSFFGKVIIGRFFYRIFTKYKDELKTTQKDWILLFFWALFTHPILDAFTGYGTQLFLPFSKYRVAFSNISVADPSYTIPFLICLIVVLFFNRKNPKRKLWLKFGLGISSLYMLFTIGNKLYVNSVFKKSLAIEGISYERYSTQASILNNILWYGIAETKDSYHVAFYSILDSKPVFSDWKVLPKSHDLISRTNPDLAKLAWFSNDYYSLTKNADGTFLYNDLRYPMVDTGNGGSQPVFGFTLFEDGNRLNMKPFEPRFEEGDGQKMLRTMWKRIKGI